jgi:hypothetical protein
MVDMSVDKVGIAHNLGQEVSMAARMAATEDILEAETAGIAGIAEAAVRMLGVADTAVRQARQDSFGRAFRRCWS